MPGGDPGDGLTARRHPTASGLAGLADRLRIEATDRGVARLGLGPAALAGGPRARRIAERARQQVREYLEGHRRSFSVPVDLGRLTGLRARVLAEARRIPFGRAVSYAALAALVGRPRAARAVGSALARNPVPILIPCHRVVRSDGTWGPYALGPGLKTLLLALERATPPRKRAGRRAAARARPVLRSRA